MINITVKLLLQVIINFHVWIHIITNISTESLREIKYLILKATLLQTRSCLNNFIY